MQAFTAEEMRELRKHIEALSIPEAQQDEVIRLIDQIVISWIDQAFNMSSVQLSLSARANYAFNGASTRDSLHKSERFEPVDLDDEGAIHMISPKRDFAP